MNNHSKLFSDQRWILIHSGEDDFELMNKINNKSFDVIYINTLHEPNHVKKIIYYYNFLKV